MFDGTDLSVAYPSTVDEPVLLQQQGPPPPAVLSSADEQAPMSHATPPDQPYRPPPAMFLTQPMAAPQSAYQTVTLWDRMMDKRYEVLKLVLLASVVVLGISMDRLFAHYLTNYIRQAALTDAHEFLVRAMYPAAIVLALWVVKATI